MVYNKTMRRKRRWLLPQPRRLSITCGWLSQRVSSFVHPGHTINTELIDRNDIGLLRRCTFTGQVNNVLCHSQLGLTAKVRFKLFRSHCSSRFGCELRHPNSIKVSILSVPKLDTGRVHPRVGSGWVGLGWVGLSRVTKCFPIEWVGLGRV